MSDKLIRKSEILNIPDNKKREIACEYTGLSLSEIDTIRKFSRNQRHCLYAIISSTLVFSTLKLEPNYIINYIRENTKQGMLIILFSIISLI